MTTRIATTDCRVASLEIIQLWHWYLLWAGVSKRLRCRCTNCLAYWAEWTRLREACQHRVAH